MDKGFLRRYFAFNEANTKAEKLLTLNSHVRERLEMWEI
jgi:hypothetical protein